MIQLFKSWTTNYLQKNKSEVEGMISPHAANEVAKKEQRPLISTEGDLGILEELPKEVLFYLLVHLRPKELRSLFLVSRKMNFYVCHDSVWTHFYKVYCAEDNTKELPEIAPFTDWKSFFLASSYWKWDTDANKKAETIVLTHNNRTASRPTSRGSNPAVVASQPMTRYRDSFEVEILERGNWLGVGFCDEKFLIHDGPTLGTQSGCVNGSFFCQDSTSLRIQGSSTKISLDRKLQANERVRIRVDFDLNEVYFYRDGKLEGTIRADSFLEDGKLFPCINLSYGTTVTFINDIDRK